MSINKFTDKIVFSLLTNINYGKLELTNYDNKKYFFGKDSNGLNVKLKIKGVAAGNENFEWVFWIPQAKATREIKARYGNMIFNTVTESICLSGSK